MKIPNYDDVLDLFYRAPAGMYRRTMITRILNPRAAYTLRQGYSQIRTLHYVEARERVVERGLTIDLDTRVRVILLNVTRDTCLSATQSLVALGFGARQSFCLIAGTLENQ